MRGFRVRWIAILVLVFQGFLPVAAGESSGPAIPVSEGDLLLASVPVIYGEQAFLERIEQHCDDGRSPVGLVLSGGSARAFAHIGVLKRLEELGIVPDFIVSNSMGSIVGLLYAAGLSPDQILSLCSTVDIGRLFDLTLPLEGGLLDTARFAALVSLYVGTDLRIETLPIPIMVIAEDLVTKRQIWIAEGDFLTVLESSFVLPVYFSPVEYRGHMLVDGGITNLVPLDAASRFTDNLMVSTTFYEGSGINLRNSLVILNTSIDIGKRRRGIEELMANPGAVWIRCEVESFSFMDFKALDEIARQGYESASHMDEQLMVFDGRCHDDSVLEIRAAFQERQNAVLADYRLYNRVPLVRLSQRLFPAIRSYAPASNLSSFSDPYLLRDDMLFGVAYSLDWKILGFSLDGGLGWESSTTLAWYPETVAKLSVQLVPSVQATASVALSWDQGLMPSCFSSATIEMRQKYFSDRLSVSLRALLENDLSSSFALREMVLSAGACALWDTVGSSFPFQVGAAAALSLAGSYDRWFSTLETHAVFPLPWEISAGFATVVRLALDGAGDVPLYGSDPFTTRDSRILEQGSLDATTPNSCNYAAVLALSAGWTPSEFKPTFGEAVIFEQTRIGAYCSFLWYRCGQIVPATSLGVDLHIDLSFLGLNSVPFRAFAGFEMPLYRPVWGFLIGR